MNRIQFRGAARSSGYRTPQLTTAGIDRMREESNRIIQGMQEQRDAERAQREANLQAMRENAAYTERITKENRDIELRNLANQSKQQLANIQSEQQQAANNTEAAQTILTGLVDFSKTYAKAQAERQKRELEQAVAEAATVKPDAISAEEIETNARAHANLSAGAVALHTEITANAVETSEDPIQTIQGDIANHGMEGERARIVDNKVAVQGYSTLLTSRINDPERRYTAPDGRTYTAVQAKNDEYFLTDLQRQTRVDTFKFMGFADPLYAAEASKKIDEIDQVYIRRARAESLKLGQDYIEERAADIEQAGTTESVTLAFVDRLHTFGATAAHDAVEDLIADPSFPLEALRQFNPRNNGKTYDQEWPNRWSAGLKRRQEAIINQEAFERKLEEAEDRKWLNDNIDNIIEAYKQNPEQAALLVQQRYHSRGMRVPQVLKDIERAALKENRDEQLNEFQQRVKDGILDLGYVNSIEDPDLQKRAREALEEQELSKYGPETLGIKKGLVATARNLTKIDPNQESGSSTTYLVLARLEREYLTQLGLTKDPLAALENVYAMVDAGRNGKKDSPFYTDPVSTNNRVTFPNIQGVDQEAANRLLEVRGMLLEKGASIVDEPFALGSSQEMDEIFQASQSGNMIKYNRYLLEAADALGLKPTELFNAQRRTNNAATGQNKPLLTPNIVTDLVDEAPPEMRKLFLSGVDAQIERAAAQTTNTLQNYVRDVYRTGNIGPTSTGSHLDLKQVNGERFELSELDNYIEVEDDEFGMISLSELRKRTNFVGDSFDEHVARGSHGIDIGTHLNAPVHLKNGAKLISSTPTEHGDYAVIELPDGRQFSFLHGKTTLNN